MKMAVLGSGSRGNAIALMAEGRTLLVDAGFRLRSLARRARLVRVPLKRLDGIVLTHEHGDHARGATQLASRVGCPVYASPGTLRALGRRLDGITTVPVRPDGGPRRIGPFEISACRTRHDAAEPMAVAVETGGRRVGIAYDLGTPTANVLALLQECGCLVIETNHDEDMLRTGPYPPSVRRRIASAGGHLSNRSAAAFLERLYHDALETVVLAHLSDRCNSPRLAEATVRDALQRRRFRGRLVVASQRKPLAPFEVGGAVQMRLF